MIRNLTEVEMIEAGRALGSSLPPGAVIVFEGELGTGKTTLIRAIAEGLGVERPATSPTYALVHRYDGRRGPVFHVDCYRLGNTEEARDLDWEGMMTEGDVILVEWPERAKEWLPPATARYRLHHLDDDTERRGLERR